MNKIELLKKIDFLLTEAKIDESYAETNIEIMFYKGRQNGLSLARLFILDLEEEDDESSNVINQP